jgi:hypothetical protein
MIFAKQRSKLDRHVFGRSSSLQDMARPYIEPFSATITSHCYPSIVARRVDFILVGLNRYWTKEVKRFFVCVHVLPTFVEPKQNADFVAPGGQ